MVNEAFRELEDSGELSVRVYEQANFTQLDHLTGFVQAGNRTGTGSAMFRIGPLKLLGDGALGARTAYLSRPYGDDPTTSGLSVFTAEEFDRLIGYAHSHGMQVAVHCIGDACLDLVLSSLRNAMDAQPRANRRHGSVHCRLWLSYPGYHGAVGSLARVDIQKFYTLNSFDAIGYLLDSLGIATLGKVGYALNDSLLHSIM